MEWYSEDCIDDFEVPKDQEVYDRLPSPESWSKWCTDASESHEFSNQSLPMDSKLTEEDLKFNGEILSNEVESFYNGEDQSSGSRTSRGFSEDSFPQNALSCDQSDYQLDDLAGIEQLDEIFLYKRNFWAKFNGSSCRVRCALACHIDYQHARTPHGNRMLPYSCVLDYYPS